MLARVQSATPWGIEARLVEVEVDVSVGLPRFRITGLSETAVRESRERVRRAIGTSGYELPPRAVTCRLPPVDLPKQSCYFDLAIALGLLAAVGELPAEALNGTLLCGELAFDGSVRPLRGALALAELAAGEALRELIVPARSAAEAAVAEGVKVIPVCSLTEAVEHLAGRAPIAAARASDELAEAGTKHLDLSDIRGCEAAKRALEVAAAGGHHLLMVGPPGSGKTMLARRLPGILPPLGQAESVAVTKIQSLVAEEPPLGLVQQRPFRCPHSSVSSAGLLGGGSIPRPGEVSLAHGGVLFLDELPEFRRDALEALRLPLEDGEVTVVRRSSRFKFPARFALFAAMAPCPCGHLGDPRRECRCTERLVERYRSRVGRLLAEHIDMHVEVPALSLQELKGPPGEPSAEVARRVLEAREIQQRRFGADCSAPTNASMGSEDLDRLCVLEPDARRLLDVAFERLKLSARAVSRILRVSRTVADLDGSDGIRASHVAEPIQYRRLDRRA
ncbi:MAG: YifB family Mg chelatase-like AAA ATPase [bacterium]|nr:YifB family Mg chelatase-like AAA ATPase [bacterium]